MTERAFRISHLIVRLIVVVNLAAWGLMIWPSYFRAVAGGTLGRATGMWFLLSSVLLPFYVALEAWLLRRSSQNKALWIDAIFAAVWFSVFWGAALYGLGHYGIP